MINILNKRTIVGDYYHENMNGIYFMVGDFTIEYLLFNIVVYRKKYSNMSFSKYSRLTNQQLKDAEFRDEITYKHKYL